MIKVFEMFAGYGGASFALSKAGIEFQSIGYSEIDKTACQVFELNHPGVPNFGDCRNIKPEQLPDFDLLTGGFPCQPFSVNTRKIVRGKEHKSYNLFQDIVRIVKYKKPTYILLENVRGILGEKSKEVFEGIQSQLKEIGYDVRIFEGNSKDYGIPQNRERVYFVCKLGSWDNWEEPKTETLKLTIRDILENGVQRREPAIKRYPLQKESNIKKFGKITRFEAIMKSPVTKRNSNVKYEILDAPSDSVSRQQDRIYDINYSPCLTATGKDYVFEVDGKIIVLTGKECFRLMGFSNNEINLEGIDENKRYKLAGNGWDINLVSKIFKQMFGVIKPIQTVLTSIIDISKKKEIVFSKLKSKLAPEDYWTIELMLREVLK